MSDSTAFKGRRDLAARLPGRRRAGAGDFAWPALDEFNWALDWFDLVASRHRVALHVVDAGRGPRRELTFGELSESSDRIANGLRSLGVDAAIACC